MSYKPGHSVLHTQTTASNTWVINYGFDGYPVVDVLVDAGGVKTKIIPASVARTSTATVTITFTSPQTGVARVI